MKYKKFYFGAALILLSCSQVAYAPADHKGRYGIHNASHQRDAVWQPKIFKQIEDGKRSQFMAP